MIGQQRKVIRRTYGPRRIMDVQAKIVFEREPANAGKLSGTAQSSEQLDDGVFARTAHREINVSGVQRGVSVERRKISTPHNGNAGMFAFELLRQSDGGNHLRAGHNGDSKEFDRVRGGDR